MKKILLGILSIMLCLVAVCAIGGTVAADTCNGVETYAPCREELTAGEGTGEGALMDTTKVVIQTLIMIVGSISGIVIVVAGIMYAAAAGDPGKVATAKKMIIYAVIGLIVSLLAYAITSFILGALQ